MMRCFVPINGKRSRNLSSGFSLIEVLITLLVLSLGLLGAAAMHLTALRASVSSYQTSIASSAALEFEERLWIAAALRPNGCLTAADDVDDIATAWRSAWVGGVDRISLPVSATISVMPSRAIGAGTAVEFPLVLRWGEGSFADGEEDIFHFTARVVCAPPPPPPPPEPT